MENALRVIDCRPEELIKTCRHLTYECGYTFATLVVEEAAAEWQLGYIFYGDRRDPPVRVVVKAQGYMPQIPSISTSVHSADWHERETEDLFGLVFEGHPRLGDFVLHEQWVEGASPMRSESFERCAAETCSRRPSGSTPGHHAGGSYFCRSR